jgi:hypothetical protein
MRWDKSKGFVTRDEDIEIIESIHVEATGGLFV